MKKLLLSVLSISLMIGIGAHKFFVSALISNVFSGSWLNGVHLSIGRVF
jgi:hypothetical protein